MSDLRELYQEVIFDHYRQPHNFGALERASHQAEGYNPLCGDQVKVYLRVENGRIEDVRFEGQGCAISTASASLMTDALRGQTVAEAGRCIDDFHRMLTESESTPHPALGKLAVLSGVREFPARIKCATLAWHTLRAALLQQNKSVTTE
ncbi:MAG: SUF system NifU family Fe-S cluster assembly protein [Burkholderiales bacterium]|nr:SUF system NifU family Fe-S cluster assembly protein [Burkholderiales bacterium]